MSEQIKHECGIAMIRLRKPLSFYKEKYGTAFYGLNKMYLLMEKQHNRGQDGAGMANLKFDTEAGQPYIDVLKSNTSTPIRDVFQQAFAPMKEMEKEKPEFLGDVNWLKKNIPFTGEVFLGHLRYGTFGMNRLEDTHPFLRENNWKSRNLVLAGNFNLTNVESLFCRLVEQGQHPNKTGDTVTILEQIGKKLDNYNLTLKRKYKEEGLPETEISKLVSQELDVHKILSEAALDWDGGFVFVGMLGHGDAFAMRDAAGIRPAYYYMDEEVLVIASERPVIQTTFNIRLTEINELPAGHLIWAKRNGEVMIKPYAQHIGETQSCSFERIYFSRGTDADIYKERKKLGELLTPAILKEINYNMTSTVFSSIPNTASVAFHGLSEGLDEYCKQKQIEQILNLGTVPKKEELLKILSLRPRTDQIAVKDAKLRTFITQDNERDDLVSHVYDVTYGLVKEYVDNLVVVDDSIVRGTTLRQSILRILDRLGPKKIIVASSAPQIRYPDCYGIDMTRLGDFVAFQAAIQLLKDRGMEACIEEVYQKSKAQLALPDHEMINYVREIYKPFTPEEISFKIAEILKPSDIQAEVSIIYQTIEDLHIACPKNKGDWYFTGKYPTPGGNRVVSQSFVNYIEKNNQRAY